MCSWNWLSSWDPDRVWLGLLSTAVVPTIFLVPFSDHGLAGSSQQGTRVSIGTAVRSTTTAAHTTPTPTAAIAIAPPPLAQVPHYPETMTSPGGYLHRV